MSQNYIFFINRIFFVKKITKMRISLEKEKFGTSP